MNLNTEVIEDAESTGGTDKKTVHVLYHGVTLCGYGEGKLPRQWPSNHVWTYMIDQHNITCEECKRLVVEHKAKF